MIENSVFYFGEPWGAPFLDGAQRVDTPLGRPCIICQEPIAAGDRGLLRTILKDASTAESGAIHAECEALGLVGHTFGVCTCTGHDTTSRASARLLWERLRERMPALKAEEQP